MGLVVCHLRASSSKSREVSVQNPSEGPLMMRQHQWPADAPLYGQCRWEKHVRTLSGLTVRLPCRYRRKMALGTVLTLTPSTLNWGYVWESVLALETSPQLGYTCLCLISKQPQRNSPLPMCPMRCRASSDLHVVAKTHVEPPKPKMFTLLKGRARCIRVIR